MVAVMAGIGVLWYGNRVACRTTSEPFSALRLYWIRFRLRPFMWSLLVRRHLFITFNGLHLSSYLLSLRCWWRALKSWWLSPLFHSFLKPDQPLYLGVNKYARPNNNASFLVTAHYTSPSYFPCALCNSVTYNKYI